MILIPVLEVANTIFARVSIILNLEEPFFIFRNVEEIFAVEVLGFFTGDLKVFIFIFESVKHAASFEDFFGCH